MGQFVSSLNGSSGGSGTGGFFLIAHSVSTLKGSSNAASDATVGLAAIPELNEEVEEVEGLGLTTGGAEWTGHSFPPNEKGSAGAGAGADSLIKGLEWDGVLTGAVEESILSMLKGKSSRALERSLELDLGLDLGLGLGLGLDSWMLTERTGAGSWCCCW